MGRIRLRHQESEKIIARARQQALVREKQAHILRAKGQIPPPEASLLGVWQIIEKNVLFNANPDQVTGLTLGDSRIYFDILTPEGNIFGKFISSGGIRLTGPLAKKPCSGTQRYTLTGGVTSEGLVQYRLDPKREIELKEIFSGRVFTSWFFRLDVTAKWEGWELEGTARNKEHGFEEEFKAVRIGPEQDL